MGSLTASAAAGVLLAGATAAFGWDPWLYVYAVGGTALVWLFHLDNIQRLLAGHGAQDRHARGRLRDGWPDRRTRRGRPSPAGRAA